MSPLLIIPNSGEFLWKYYFELIRTHRRVTDGICNRILPSEYKAWSDITGQIIYPSEIRILVAMDDAYCQEMDKELKDFRERENERRDNENKNKNKSWKRPR